jgi:hypothetical protein
MAVGVTAPWIAAKSDALENGNLKAGHLRTYGPSTGNAESQS